MVALVTGGVQHIVEKLVLVVPQVNIDIAHVVHGVGNVEKVLKELAGDVFVGGVGLRQLQGHLQHIQAVHGHPAGAIRLLQVAARGQL